MKLVSSVGRCVFCDEICLACSSIQCVECLNYYHLHCCGITKNLFQTATAICKLLSWTCDGCRIATNEEIKKLRLDIADLRKKNELTSTACTDFNKRRRYFRRYFDLVRIYYSGNCSANSTSRTATAAAPAFESHNTISSVVLQTLSVLDKKKKTLFSLALMKTRMLAIAWQLQILF